MYYEMRMYTPLKGKLNDYAEVFHTYPKPVFEKLGAKVLGEWAVDGSEQPAFVYLLAFQDQAHRTEVFAKLREFPEMREYGPQRAQLIDPHIADANWLLTPLAHSALT